MRKIARSGMACVATLALCGPSAAGDNLVFNGGFEQGFAGWSVPPNAPPGPNGAFFSAPSNSTAHSGSRYAVLSSVQLQFISQFLPGTVAGTDYELEFWLRMPGPNTPPPLPFRVRWEGQFVFNELVGGTPEILDWTRFTVPLHSNFSGSLLEFGQNLFPGEWHIDTISVRQVPAPSAAPMLALGGVVAFRRRQR
ncbi:MAG: hypothetical protein KF699_04930 [Phycisphaeraceae bacterium]|nr:hypothetical protein [Phycisphaeraceae bacterium]